MPDQADQQPDDAAVMLIHAEEATVTKRRAETLVRATRTTGHRAARIEEDLADEHVVVERVPVDRRVDSVPPPREEGDTIILPVVEEVLVVERRLVLKEEVHLRRVRTVRRHVETVKLRQQEVTVTRTELAPRQTAASGHYATNQHTKEKPMIDKNPNTIPPQDTYVAPQGASHGAGHETIVAVFDSQAQAQAAIRELRTAGIPETAISQHSGSEGAGSATTAAPHQERGFWSTLFGGDTEHDTNVYDRSLESGSTVVTVRVPEAEAARVTQILEEHNPVDIDERASGYGLTSTAGTSVAGTGAAAGTGIAGAAATAAPGRTPAAPVAGTATGATSATGTEDTLQLSEEQITVGKRLVNRGGTRIRRYVVERPVEEQVTLHDEKVVLERRPVTDGRPVSGAEFTDKTIELTETHEEAVVGKTARVVEEVALRKEGTEHVETVRDTVRREEVEVEQLSGGTAASGTAGTPGTPPRGTGA